MIESDFHDPRSLVNQIASCTAWRWLSVCNNVIGCCRETAGLCLYSRPHYALHPATHLQFTGSRKVIENRFTHDMSCLHHVTVVTWRDLPNRFHVKSLNDEAFHRNSFSASAALSG